MAPVLCIMLLVLWILICAFAYDPKAEDDAIYERTSKDPNFGRHRND